MSSQGGGGGGEYSSFFRWTYTTETCFNTVVVTAAEAPMTRDHLHVIRGRLWVAIRDLLAGKWDNLSPKEVAAYDSMRRDIDLIDRALRENRPLLHSSLEVGAAAMTRYPPVVPGYDIQPVIPESASYLLNRKYEEFKEHYARTGSEESFERMLECVYIDE